MNNISLEQIIRLYYRYKGTSNDRISQHLEKIKLVRLTNNGPGSTYGYYEISPAALEKIKETPRNFALTFNLDRIPGNGERIPDLFLYKTMLFLVKSSSRFFYKPDIGEILDAIHYEDLTHIKAIDIDTSNYQMLPETDGEHFLCTIKLLTSK